MNSRASANCTGHAPGHKNDKGVHMFLRRSLFAAALLGSVGFATPMQPTPIVRAAAQRPRVEAKRISRSSPTSFQFGYLNHGPTTAQQQRAAKKVRNVKRHKQHVRGAN